MSDAAEASTSPLSNRQKKRLRSLAHPLKAVVHVGEKGLSEALLGALDDALGRHELVKVRLHAPEDKKAAAAELAERSGAELCGLVGHTVILFRRNAEEPTIELPEE